MSKAKISVGDDTATGEPANGPKGPYITDDSDDEMRDAQDKRDREDRAKDRAVSGGSSKSK